MKDFNKNDIVLFGIDIKDFKWKKGVITEITEHNNNKYYYIAEMQNSTKLFNDYIIYCVNAADDNMIYEFNDSTSRFVGLSINRYDPRNVIDNKPSDINSILDNMMNEIIKIKNMINEK